MFKALESKGWMDPFYTHDVEWDEAGGTWVPISFRSKYLHRLPTFPIPTSEAEIEEAMLRPKLRVITHLWTIDWISVNKNIADDRFELDAFAVPEHTRKWTPSVHLLDHGRAIVR